MCGKKRERRSKGDTLWWNEEVKEAVSRKKDAHKAMCRSSTVENRMRYEACKIRQRKLFQMQSERRLKTCLLNKKIAHVDV